MVKTENVVKVLEAEFGVEPNKVSKNHYVLKVEDVEFTFSRNEDNFHWNYGFKASPLSGFRIGSFPQVSDAVRAAKKAVVNRDLTYPEDEPVEEEASDTEEASAAE